MRRHLSWLAWLCTSAYTFVNAQESTPSVSARVQASWNEAPLVVQYLQTLALEQGSDALFSVLNHVSDEAAVHDYLALGRLLSSRSFKMISELGSDAECSHWMSKSTSDTHSISHTSLLANETLRLMDNLVEMTLDIAEDGATMDSLRISMATQETSVVIAGMAELDKERRQVLSSGSGEFTCDDNWIDLGDKAVCSEQEFWQAIGVEQKDKDGPLALDTHRPQQLYPFDHIRPHSAVGAPVVVFYAAPTSNTCGENSFFALYRFLHKLATPYGNSVPRIQLVVRWSSVDIGQRLTLSGYGGSLDIKKSDYLAIDDRNTEGQKQTDNKETRAEQNKIEPVKKRDITDLALRTASLILRSDSPLETFVKLTSTFPSVASHLSNLVPEIDRNLIEELGEFQSMSPLAQRPSFHVNGMHIPEKSVEPLSLIRILRKERKLVKAIQSISKNITPKQARSILTSEAITAAATGEQRRGGQATMLSTESLGDLFDAGDLEEGGDLILWWNDIEKDKKYISWPQSLQEMLKPTYPGSMNLVRRNLNNVVFVLDLSRASNLLLLAENVRQFISRGLPIRFGLVPQVALDGTDSQERHQASPAVAQVLWYLVDRAGRAAALGLCGELGSTGKDVTIASLKRAYSSVRSEAEAHLGEELAPFEEIVVSENRKVQQAQQYVERLALSLSSEEQSKDGGGYFFLNGALFPLDDDWMQNLQRALSGHIQYLQQAIYFGQLGDTQDVNRYFFEQPSTHKRRNAFIFPSEQNPLKFINLAEVAGKVSNSLFAESFFESVDVLGASNATVYFFTDLGTIKGRQLASEFLKTARKSFRIALVHNPAALTTDEADFWPDLAHLAHNNVAKATKILERGSFDAKIGKSKASIAEAAAFGALAGARPGDNLLLVNGRVVGSFQPGQFSSLDLGSLVDFELRKRIAPAVDALSDSGVDVSSLSKSDSAQAINVLSSILSLAALPDPVVGMFGGISPERRRDWSGFELPKSSLVIGDEEEAFYELAVFIDPATELAQRWSPILHTLSKQRGILIRLYLNPAMRLAELPIKRFYNFIFKPALEFGSTTGSVLYPQIQFQDMPENTLLTFATDLPNAWLAFPIDSVHDLDNIRLSDLSIQHKSRGVEAVFELQSLIVEGHAREMPVGSPPRGLQLELLRGTNASTTIDKHGDTIVMANLGYFQLKANPGPWRLAIRPGKSAEVYSFESIGAQGWTSGDVTKTGDSLFVSTLEGFTLYPRLKRNEGYETVNLLDDSDDNTIVNAKGMVNKIKNMFPFLGSKPLAKKQAEINVFTVASGLLYERMAFLMMVSVMRHTKSTVKFWFIQNFLSPSFRAFVPHMAKEYGFEYEMVTYKWPHWLRAQKEKQRTIWGYKILFLDVLFPLELDRVIFVDSDQIVRTDLKELIDMDIGGAPYAYAPMGDDRPEMEGFRFWKTGYWKEHLRTKPYHISALYLVDLDRFRKTAAGDRLRQQYQGLSADPNSLANLDQDLPNNLQHTLPIFTLDRSWLWCETWCSDESLSQAKTIDLCNNPLTHEPKLQRAKRLIPEWTVYDDEIAALAKRVAAEQQRQSAVKSPETSKNVDEFGSTNDNQKGMVGDMAGVFGQTADKLEQAKEQSQEKVEFEQQQEQQRKQESKAFENRVKDEL
ncbi:killer toxin resistant protein [Microbotryomycetes sp. JL221]|nr:killer toxin resistant protein [Microbotryomycetes sp. JL221]